MEWAKIIGEAIQYMECRLTDDFSVDRMARHLGISSFYLQKGFAMMCGFSVAEYMRNRRLALAGREIASTDAKIIDIALKYGYDSPDSFTRAFTRFHGATPTAVRNGNGMLKTFAPLKIKILLEGGNLMEYRIEKKQAFTVIASRKTFTYEEATNAVPIFWSEHFRMGRGKVVAGEFGINIDETMGMDKFDYLIADLYQGGEVPAVFELFTVPAFEWAVFPCRGGLPKALQDINRMIYTEWISGAQEYEFAAGYCIEQYDDPENYPNGVSDENYRCEIWVPIRKK